MVETKDLEIVDSNITISEIKQQLNISFIFRGIEKTDFNKAYIDLLHYIFSPNEIENEVNTNIMTFKEFLDKFFMNQIKITKEIIDEERIEFFQEFEKTLKNLNSKDRMFKYNIVSILSDKNINISSVSTFYNLSLMYDYYPIIVNIQPESKYSENHGLEDKQFKTIAGKFYRGTNLKPYRWNFLTIE